MLTPHCEYQIEVKQNIMYCTMSGTWNVEGTLQYFEAIKQQADQLKEDKWCRIVNAENFEGGPLEVMETLINIQNWSLANNCMLLVLVGSRSLNKGIIEKNKSQYHGMELADSMDEAEELAAKILLT